MRCTALTPPAPLLISKKNADEKKDTDGSANRLSGRNLLDLVRTLEKTSVSEGSSPDLESALSTLESLRLAYTRRGLLGGDSVRAEQVLSKASEGAASAADQRRGGGKRRKKGGGVDSHTGRLNDGLGGAGRSSSGGGTLDDEGFLFSALGRILGVGQTTKKGGDSAGYSLAKSGAVINKAADIIAAICRYATTYLPAGGACASAEYELLLPICPQLLTGLGRTAGSLLTRMRSEGSFDDEDDMAVASCHRAAASMVCLLGTRLSRSTAALEQVRSSALDALFDVGVGDLGVESAASLLAALPLAGNSDGVPPAKLWSEAVQRTTSSIILAINSFLPIFKFKSMQKTSGEDDWIQSVQVSLTSQADRASVFRRRIQGYAAVLSSLLDMEGYDARAESDLLAASLPISSLLDLVELMMAFPSVAETKYLSTKLRLRDISVENGLLSPNSAIDVANTIKSHGHKLFDCVASSLRGSGLMHGKRMLRMACASLQASSSYALRRSIDPAGTPVARADGKRRRRWLHNSIPLRAMAVKSFKRILLGVGPSAVSASGGGVSKSLVLVSGCLLEQTIMEDNGNYGTDGDADWGNLGEQIDLATACADTMASAVAVGGAYLQSQTRATIESVASTCLSNITNSSSPILTFAPTKCSLLKLGTNCICSPWPDGAASTLTGLMRKVAAALKLDKDCEVSTSAYSALSVCDALLAPRAPAMIVITRGSGNAVSEDQVSFGKKGAALSSTTLLEGIRMAKRESAAAATSNKRKDVGDNDGASADRMDEAEKRQKKDGADKSSAADVAEAAKDDDAPAAHSETAADKGKIEQNDIFRDSMNEGKHFGHNKDDSCPNTKDQVQEPPIEQEDIHDDADPAQGAQGSGIHQDLESPSEQNASGPAAGQSPKESAGQASPIAHREDEDSEGDMDFPDIVDCGPDVEDD